MTKLILIGSERLFCIQEQQITALLEKYNLPALPRPSLQDVLVGGLSLREEVFSCRHYNLNIPSMLSSASTNQKLFLVSAAKVPGVYINDCPEHAKRRFWSEQERLLKISA